MSIVLYMNFQKLFLQWNVKSAVAENWNWIKGIPGAKKANETFILATRDEKCK